jgi:hypothetical protein
MKPNFNKIFILLSLTLFNQIVRAQDIEKLNKSELREQYRVLSTKYDSLFRIQTNLEASKSSLNEKNSQLENIKKKNEEDISELTKNINSFKLAIKLNEGVIAKIRDSIVMCETLKKNLSTCEELTKKNNIKIDLLEQTNKKGDDEISALNKKLDNKIKEQENCEKEILKLKDSINKLILAAQSIQVMHSDPTLKPAATDKNDFLNKYFFDQIPLPYSSFSLVLTKILVGDIQTTESGRNYNNYDYSHSRGTLLNIPEILNANEFIYWDGQPEYSQKKYSAVNDNDNIIARKSDFFDSELPKIEILKNKLFTLKYKDGVEESFLLNTRKSSQVDKMSVQSDLGKYIDLDSLNNYRKYLQIELASEDVKSDGTNNTEKDIVWRIFAIEKECYLVLTYEQLRRMKVELHSVNDYKYENGEQTTPRGIYLSRRKDPFMNTSYYANPKDLIFLFKLK